MNSNENRLFDLIRNSKNPEKALRVAIEIILKEANGKALESIAENLDCGEGVTA